MSAEAPAAVTDIASQPVLESFGVQVPEQRTARLAGIGRARLDVLTVAAAVGASLARPAATGGLSWKPDIATILFGLLCLALYRSRGLYRPRVVERVLDDIAAIIQATTAAAMVVVALRVVLHTTPALALDTIRPWVFALVYVCGGRLWLAWSQAERRAEGLSLRPTLIVGSGRVARLLAARFADRPRLGIRVVGLIDDDPQPYDGDELGPSVIGGLDDLEDLVQVHRVEQIIVAFSGATDERLLALVNRAEALGVPVSVVPRLYEKMPERVTVEHLGGLPLVTPHPTRPQSWHYRVKYALDRIAAAGLLLLASPVLLACAAAVWLTMGRPIFFRQPRVGLDGEEFEMLKFRSMRAAPAAAGTSGEADAAWLASQLGEASAQTVVFDADNRRTPIGTFLRKTSLDELPQLFNVLKGEMSLIGPRPERTSYVRQLEDRIYRYADRHRVRCGITGWAQVHGLRGDTSLSDRVEWDNFYVENASLWLDLKILLLTIRALVAGAR